MLKIVTIASLAALALVIAVCIIAGYSALIPAVITGACLAYINFGAIVLFVRHFFSRDLKPSRYLLIALFLGKFFLLGLVVFIVIAKLHMNGLGVILGLSVVFLSIITSGLHVSLTGARGKPSNGSRVID